MLSIQDIAKTLCKSATNLENQCQRNKILYFSVDNKLPTLTIADVALNLFNGKLTRMVPRIGIKGGAIIEEELRTRGIDKHALQIIFDGASMKNYVETQNGIDLLNNEGKQILQKTANPPSNTIKYELVACEPQAPLL